jgi:hypothetical protein
MVVSSRHGYRVRRCASHFVITTSSMKVYMVVFQMKGSSLLWWKTILPHLNMDVDDVSLELFTEWFQERYLSEESIEHHLNDFNTLQQGSHTVPEYEACFMELLRYSLSLNTEKLKVKKFVFGLNVRIQLLLWVPGKMDRSKCARMWGAILPARLPSGEDQSIWMSWTHYHGRFGKGPWDSCSGE